MSTTSLSSRVQLSFVLCLFGIVSISALNWILSPSDSFLPTEADNRRAKSGPTVGQVRLSPPKRHKAILGMPMDLSGDTDPTGDTDFDWWSKPRDHYKESLEHPFTEEQVRFAEEHDAWVDMPDPFCASYTAEELQRCEPEIIPARCCNH